MTETKQQPDVENAQTTVAEDEAADSTQEVCFSQDEMLKTTRLIEEKDQLLADMTDRYKRLQADFDNFRRRTRIEKEEMSQVVAESVVAKLLPIIDNFERALTTGTGQDSAAIMAGVELIYRQFMTTLEKLDVKPIEAVGSPFDPQLHEAVMSVSDESNADGTVLEEFQRGYIIGSKVIRPSMVKVVTNS